MTIPSAPPPFALTVLCAGCSTPLTTSMNVVEFVCPACQMPQRLPPMPLPPLPPPSVSPPQSQPPVPPAGAAAKKRKHATETSKLRKKQNGGSGSSKVEVPCRGCKGVFSVPASLTKFACPKCGVENPVETEEINELAVEVERDEDEGGTAGETFTDYRPAKVSMGPPHPDPVVETSSLSAVQPPEPTYDPILKDYLESSKALSCLQIETLVYACQRHLLHLPDGTRAGFFIGDGAGVGKGRSVAGLIWENWQQGREKALWISVGSDLKFDARRDLDDMGATCVKVHALNKLPYSKLSSKSVGVKDGVVFSTYSSLIASSDKGQSRLKQLVQWCGPKFDGLIIFDECHKAKNLMPEAKGGMQPTQTGKAVLDIQAQLPEARVVYCSATGASEPRNMAYMVRLGLWGDGTSFCDFKEFLGALDKGGVGALELVAMDMKARGMYLCRTLSYKGADFEVIEAPLEDKMMDIYEKAAKFWSELRVDLLSTTSNAFLNVKFDSRTLWRLYWSCHQRFFRHVCLSAKVPATVRLVKQALMEDKCVVIGLQSTGEARTEGAVAKYGFELDDFISGPQELLEKFVDDCFPLPENPELHEKDALLDLEGMGHSTSPCVSGKVKGRNIAKVHPSSNIESYEESETDTDPEMDESDYEPEGEESEMLDLQFSLQERHNLLSCSGCGKLVHQECLSPPIHNLTPEKWLCTVCKGRTNDIQPGPGYLTELKKRYDAALDHKTKLLETIRKLDLPINPLDDIIDQLGGTEKVAEITGRKGRLVRAPSGKGVIYEPRNKKDISMEMVNMHEKKLFLDAKKFVAIISEAGSAGFSLHADRRVINQKRRVHITLELPWSADKAIQQFGRTHRSKQASAPEYRVLFSNLGGERSFASVVAKRLESLGALTQGDRRAGPSLSAYNYDSSYGKRALMIMYEGILEQDSLPVVPPGCLSDNPVTINEFIMEAKAALLSVGIVKGYEEHSGSLSGYISDNDMQDVRRFLNRLLGLPPDIQNRLFELFASIFDHLIQNARIEGNLDTGIVDMKANVVELQGTPKTVYIDPVMGASTVLFTFILDRGTTWQLATSMLNEKQKGGLGSVNDGFYESKREWLGRRHFILAFESSVSNMYKIVRPTVGESFRDMHLSELKRKYKKVSCLKNAQKGWEVEYNVSSKQCMHGPKCKLGNFCTVGRSRQEVNILGGAILPLWRAIEKALSLQFRRNHRRLRVVRIETSADNQHIVGVLVPNAAVKSVLQGLEWVPADDN
ncbi:protein FORGETTER 1 [Arachis hypogaea]|uniref:protein FORGETTER 1 n=1 Tax=Arachis hypogaea TaxID=3818 RepID=UPI003B228BE9